MCADTTPTLLDWVPSTGVGAFTYDCRGRRLHLSRRARARQHVLVTAWIEWQHYDASDPVNASSDIGQYEEQTKLELRQGTSL
ncbi:hypothetical protein LSAT2_012254 [Lamellibrachia satsuma]|nr:hypothetical protein LSAT2_012254 [Lamellibrachia satsuma]